MFMEGWKKYKLGDIGTIVGGATPSTKNGLNYDGDISWITPKDLANHSGRYISRGERMISQKGFDSCSCRMLPRNSILFSSRAPIGYVAIANNELCTNQGFKSIIPNDNIIDSLFLYYLLVYYRPAIENMGSGTTFQEVSGSVMKNIEVNIPGIDDQKEIASILSSLDSKIELNRRINDNLEQQAQALFKAWFVDFVPFKDGEFVDSELGSTPKELPIVYIEDIPHNIESGKRPKGGATLEGIPSIGAENIKGLGYYDYSKTKYIPEEYAKTIRKGKINGYELLIYKDGGKPGYFMPNFTIFGEGFPFSEMYINEHVFILDLMDNGYNAFAYFYMRTPYIMNQLNSIGGKAAIPGINTKDVECLPIYAKESPYVKKFGEIVLPYIKTILSNSLENAKLAKVRDALLPKLMSGELEINSLNI